MKKYLSGAFAVVLAIGFSAFTKKEVKPVEDKKQTVLYYVFSAAGTPAQEKIVSQYTTQTTRPGAPADGACAGAAEVCWLRVTDLNGDGVVNNADFTIRVNQLDTDSDGIISDNQADAQLNIYEERS